MKLNFDFDAKTLLSKWWTIVRDNFQKIQDEFNSHVDEFNSHVKNFTAFVLSCGQRIDNLNSSLQEELEDRIESDTALGKRIDDEAAAREELDERFKPVAEMAHTHNNKDILDAIDADRVKAWDTIADGTVTLGEYLEHLAESERQFGMLWDLFGMTVYDGGWYGMAQLDAPLDGGSFDDTALTPLDCGDFGKYVPSGGGSIGDIVDGGTY